MAAGLTDKFRKGAPFFQTTLSGSISDSDTSFTVASATGLPTDTAIDFVIDRIDQNGELLDPSLREVITGTVSGTTITTDATRRGLDNTTAQAHTAGAVVEVNFTSDTWNDHIDGLLTSLNQDGTIKDDVVDTAQIADGAVETDQINDSAVTTAKIADANVTAPKMQNITWNDIASGTTITSVGGGSTITSSSVTAAKWARIHGSGAGSIVVVSINLAVVLGGTTTNQFLVNLPSGVPDYSFSLIESAKVYNPTPNDTFTIAMNPSVSRVIRPLAYGGADWTTGVSLGMSCFLMYVSGN